MLVLTSLCPIVMEMDFLYPVIMKIATYAVSVCNYPGFSQTLEKSKLIALGLLLHFHKFFVNFS